MRQSTFFGLGLLVLGSIATPGLVAAPAGSPDLAAVDEEIPHARLEDVASWLGTYELGGEAITLRFENDGLTVDLGPFTIPADGLWHESTEPFAVTHRITWNRERHALRLDELFNNAEIRWHYELRAVPEKARLERFRVPESGEPMLVRVYPRIDLPAAAPEE